MKKYMIPAIAFLLITGTVNAQAQKTPAKTPGVKQASVKTTAGTSSSTATVSPKPVATQKANTPIKRKHHHKSKAAKKIEKK